jgi:NAD(P)-dependent dehydrogenase (short-subunit alcohol dehydrogenase family)
MSEIRFDGRVAIVTGAGGGLGRCHALELARRGAKVVVNDLGGSRDGAGGGSDAAKAVVQEIEAFGGEAIANGSSVSDVDGVKKMIDDTMAKWGRIDIIIANAGILRDRSFSKMSVDDIDLVLAVHLRGSFLPIHAAWDIMKAQNYGRIVVTTSSTGLYGNFGQANYGAAKMGMWGLMNVLAIEGVSKNVKVNCLSPGAATRMTASVPGATFDPDAPPPDRGPDLVTPAVLYMCSENAPTGYVIQAAGGRFSRTQIFANEGVTLPWQEATYENLVANIDKVVDMSQAVGRNPTERPPRR